MGWAVVRPWVVASGALSSLKPTATAFGGMAGGYHVFQQGMHPKSHVGAAVAWALPLTPSPRVLPSPAPLCSPLQLPGCPQHDINHRKTVASPLRPLRCASEGVGLPETGADVTGRRAIPPAPRLAAAAATAREAALLLLLAPEAPDVARLAQRWVGA